MNWKVQVVLSLLLRGNVYCFQADPDPANGYPRQLPVIATEQVQCEVVDGMPLYWVNSEGPYGPLDILHFRGPMMTGDPCGMGVVEVHRRGLGFAMDIDTYGSATFAHGAVPPIILHVNRPELSREQAQDIQERWMVAHGYGNRSPAVLPSTITTETVAFSPQDAEYLNSRVQSAVEVCWMFGVDPRVLRFTGRPRFAYVRQPGDGAKRARTRLVHAVDDPYRTGAVAGDAATDDRPVRFRADDAADDDRPLHRVRDRATGRLPGDGRSSLQRRPAAARRRRAGSRPRERRPSAHDRPGIIGGRAMKQAQIHRDCPLDIIDIRRSSEGRTLVGRALLYNERNVVSDDGRTSYVETWLPGVFSRSIAERGSRGKIALFGRHDIGRWPYGAVQRWDDGPDALGFEAKVSRTTAGDELLELINDGAITGISVGAEPIENRTIPGGVARAEAKLMELSVCVFPQLAGAEILAVRERPEPAAGTVRLDAAKAFLDGLTRTC